ncbi:MAG: hypothetical protein AAF449_01880 [Myxococcota bacterium]
MSTLIAWGLILVAADGISIDLGDIDFSPAEGPALCWIGPQKMRTKTRRELARAMEEAAQSTRPLRNQWPIKQVRLLRSDSEQCRNFVRIYVRHRNTITRFALAIKTDEQPEFEVLYRWESPRRKLDGPSFERGWTAVWARLAPPPPPPPRPQPSSQYVDKDLAAEQIVVPPPPPAASRPALLSAWVEGGWTGRRLSDAPGAAQSSASVATAGLRLTLHSDGFMNADGPSIDLTGRYRRRFVRATQDGTVRSVTADLWSVDATTQWTIATNFRLGPVVGYELTRFESDASDALSTRFSVIRFGGVATYDFASWAKDGRLTALTDAAARWSPVGDAQLGFDVQVGLQASFSAQFRLALLTRWTRQTGEVANSNFVDQTVDAIAAVGWSI